MGRGELDLDLERRRRILELIQAYPGLHLSEIARRLDWSPMLAEYHLRVLEKHDLVSSVEEAHYHRYYARIEKEGMRVDALGAAEKRLLGMLRHPVRLHIVALLANQPGTRNKDVATALGLSRPATSYQLGRLLAAGIAAKDADDRYSLVDASTVTRLLLAYRPPSDQVERFKDLWDALGSSA